MRFKILFVLFFVVFIFSSNSYAERFYEFEYNNGRFNMNIDDIIAFGEWDNEVLIYVRNFTEPIRINSISYECFKKLLDKKEMQTNCNCICDK